MTAIDSAACIGPRSVDGSRGCGDRPPIEKARKHGTRYISLMDGCALVTDIDWVREPARGIAPGLPCAMKVFENARQDDAARWLTLPTHPL